VSYGDFDQITKSKTMQNLMDVKDERVLGATALTLSSLLSEPLHAEDDRSLLARQKCLIGLQFKVAAASLRHAEKASVSKEKGGARVARTIFSQWITGVCGLESTEAQHSTDRSSNANLLAGARDFMRERLTLGFEQALKLGPVGCEVLRDTVLEIHSMEEDGIPMATSFEDDVLDIVQGAWEQLSSLSTSFQASQPSGKAKADSTKKDISDSSSTFSDGLCLLYCLILFQIYTGESDAVEVLKDLLESHQRMIASTKGKPKPSPDVDAAEAIVEIILSFASRPSKFLRRISIQVFEAFAPSMTSSGLEALCRILTTPENVQGQQEMFQGEDNMDIEEADGASDEKEDALDSDVEVESVSAADGEATDDEGSADDSDNEEDEELAAFDAALAAALGTRPLDQNDVAGASSDSDSASDADMNDDEMMELDSKLAEVFRARNEQQAKNKKKESKEAKENVVNFKNRVLDLVESYLKVQPQKPLTLDLIVPLLTLARTTQTKQLADHACNILEKFNARCKGPNVPELTAGSQVSHALDILGSIHDEAGMDSSNAHSITASLMSIAVVKTLVKQDPANIAAVVEMYASTRMKQLTKKQCRILPGFFTDWNNWCTQAKAKLSK
jgi:DNA polymerase phi